MAKECFLYSYYLRMPNTSEEAEYLSNSQDFDFIGHILWRMTIIELSKLFSSSVNRDKFNLRHFISKLKQGVHYGKSGINEVEITKWETELVNNEKLITDVLTIRDKVYAHTDRNKDSWNTIEITFQQVEKLIKIAESVIQEIYLTVFDSDTDMGTLIFDRKSFEIIKILAEEKKRRIIAMLGPKFIIK